jgi:S1-C subfamily serine protease
VVEVVSGSPAAKAGVRPEDLIVALDATPVAGPDDLQRLMSAERIGARSTLTVVRDGARVDLAVTPVELED